MIISVTERGDFMRCRQSWDWGSFNRDAWTPIMNKPALSIGSLYHRVQAEWSLHPEQDPNILCLTLANEEEDKIKRDYLSRIGAPISQIELDPFLDGVGLVIAMINNYQKRWGTPLPDGFSMVAPEQTCVIPIPDTEHKCTECDGTGLAPDAGDVCLECMGDQYVSHFLSGTLDGLIQSDDGRIYILERKTYGQRPNLEVLNMQDQFLAYLWILRSLGIGEVGGLAYDGAWKRKQPPRDKILEDLFLRTLLNRNKIEVDRFAKHARAQVLEMANNPFIYPNRKWDGCWDCSFVAPCIAQERGEDFMYLLNTKYVKRPKTEDSTRELKLATTD